MSDVQYMPIGEFVEGGYLQEVNRRLLHPLGLALEVTVTDEPSTWLALDDRSVRALHDMISLALQAEHLPAADLERLSKRLKDADRRETGASWVSGVWDYRGDPEGIVFGGNYQEKLAIKAAKVDEAWAAREPARVQMLGEMVQGVGPLPEDVEPRTIGDGSESGG